MNTVKGPQRRGGVRKGKSWTHEAVACYEAALILRRSFGYWERHGRALLAQALRVIANHSRSVVVHVEAEDLLRRLEARR